MFSGIVRVFTRFYRSFLKRFSCDSRGAKWGGISTIAVVCYIAIAANLRPSKNYPFTEHYRVCYIAAVGLLSGF
jgi:hypothetical protein